MLRCHLLSIKTWSIWLWAFPSGEVQVYLWMFWWGNIVLITIRFFDVAKFTILTPLLLLSWCRLLFPIVGYMKKASIWQMVIGKWLSLIYTSSRHVDQLEVKALYWSLLRNGWRNFVDYFDRLILWLFDKTPINKIPLERKLKVLYHRNLYCSHHTY
jgi:hypothetical protein